MIEKIKLDIKNLLKLSYPDLNPIVEEPKDLHLGDIAVPLFEMMKKYHISLPDCKDEIDKRLVKEFNDIIKSTTLIKGFLNIELNKELIGSYILNKVFTDKEKSGLSDIGINKTMVIDYSSPNIAKPFSIGHLRSTIIGEALSKLYEKCGYKVVRINHLGDWGTQFGKLIVAYKLWGSKESVQKNPINELVSLYVKYNETAENDPKLLEAGRVAFKELENGNEEYFNLWNWFKEESLKEFNRMYDWLGVKFDYYQGEAFYTDKMDKVIAELETKKLLVEDDGAIVVLLDGMIPALIKKSDGASLYITRDLAALFYRHEHFNFDKMLYVIGNEQSLHINQLKAVIKKMGYDIHEKIEHINFGLVLKDGKKMSTRKGRIVKLETVLDEATNIANEYIENKNPNLINKEEVAEKIGVSAIIFNDLKNHRIHDIEFNLNQMLQFEGQTGPYLQYTSVRINSILKQVKQINLEIATSLFNQDHYFEIIRTLDKFKKLIEKAVIENDPSVIAKYALTLASQFNKFYGIEKILVEDNLVQNTNILLSYCVKIILDEAMRILGMKVIFEM